MLSASNQTFNLYRQGYRPISGTLMRRGCLLQEEEDHSGKLLHASWTKLL